MWRSLTWRTCPLWITVCWDGVLMFNVQCFFYAYFKITIGRIDHFETITWVVVFTGCAWWQVFFDRRRWSAMFLYSCDQMSDSFANIGRICITQTCKLIYDIGLQGLAKYLDKIIKPYISSKFMLNSTSSFLGRLKEFCFKPTDVLVSFDVVSLFTNVPLEFTINIIVDHIYEQESRPAYDKKAFKKLLEMATTGILCTRTNTFDKRMESRWVAL